MEWQTRSPPLVACSTKAGHGFAQPGWAPDRATRPVAVEAETPRQKGRHWKRVEVALEAALGVSGLTGLTTDQFWRHSQPYWLFLLLVAPDLKA